MLIGVLVVVLLVVSGVVFFMSRTPSKNSNTNESNTNTSGPVEEPAKIGSSWPKFTSPYGASVVVPKGMNPCDEKNNTFAIRTDACTDSTEPSFRYQRNAAWDVLEATAAFDDAFAQELREAGLETIAGKATSLRGMYVSGLMYTFNDSLTGVMMTELSPADGAAPRRMSIHVNRNRRPTAEGVVQDVDETVKAIIQGSRFSGQGQKSNTNTP